MFENASFKNDGARIITVLDKDSKKEIVNYLRKRGF